MENPELEIELLQSILSELQTANANDTYVIFAFGVIVGLLVSILFAKAWGRNT